MTGEIQAVDLIPGPENIGFSLDQITGLDIGRGLQGKFLVFNSRK